MAYAQLMGSDPVFAREWLAPHLADVAAGDCSDDEPPTFMDLSALLWRHFHDLPVAARVATFLRLYAHALINMMAALAIALMAASAAFLAHLFFVWMTFSGVARMAMWRPPLVVILLMHLPALRMASFLGAHLAHSLHGGLVDRNRQWRAMLCLSMQHHLEASQRSARLSAGGALCSTAVALRAGYKEPTLY